MRQVLVGGKFTYLPEMCAVPNEKLEVPKEYLEIGGAAADYFGIPLPPMYTAEGNGGTPFYLPTQGYVCIPLWVKRFAPNPQFVQWTVTHEVAHAFAGGHGWGHRIAEERSCHDLWQIHLEYPQDFFEWNPYPTRYRDCQGTLLWDHDKWLQRETEKGVLDLTRI